MTGEVLCSVLALTVWIGHRRARCLRASGDCSGVVFVDFLNPHHDRMGGICVQHPTARPDYHRTVALVEGERFMGLPNAQRRIAGCEMAQQPTRRRRQSAMRYAANPD